MEAFSFGAEVLRPGTSPLAPMRERTAGRGEAVRLPGVLKGKCHGLVFMRRVTWGRRKRMRRRSRGGRIREAGRSIREEGGG